MTIIRTWLLSVTVSAMVIAVAEALMPEGSVKKVGRLTGGLILILGLVQPLVRLDYDDLYDLVNSLPAGSIRQEALMEESSQALKTGIEQELASYIVDKAAQLGATCGAAVKCRLGEDGIPVPERVTVSGALTGAQKEALSAYLEKELGLPREAQLYSNEGSP